MPTKYADRLKIPTEGSDHVSFSTSNGLAIATGYEGVIFAQKKPYIQFSEQQINKDNIYTPENQKWRIKNSASPYIEYRSRDYCNVKIMQWKEADGTEFQMGKFYVSPFDLKSDKNPVLIPLYRKQTLQSLSA